MDYFGLKSVLFLISSISLFFSILIFLIYSINNSKKSALEFCLMAVFFLLVLRIFVIHLFANQLILDYPHFLLINNLTSRIGLPLFLFVVIFSTTPRKFNWLDSFHLLPPILFLIHFFPIFQSTTPEKINLIKLLEQSGYDQVWNMGTFKSTFLIYFMKYFSLYGYTVLILWHLFKNQNFRKIPKPLVRFFSWGLVFFGVNLIPSFYSHFINDIWEWASLVNLISFSIFLVGVFFIPDFLFSRRNENSKNFDLIPDLKVADLPKKNNLEVIYGKVDKFFKERKPFLNQDFSLKTVEKELGVSGKYVAEAIKEQAGVNFTTYVNQERLFFLEENTKIKGVGTFKDKPLEVIAQELGFKSLSSFYNSIKKQKGCTPIEFFNSLETAN